MVLWFDHGIYIDAVDAERNRIRELMSATRCNPSARYDGAVDVDAVDGSGRRGQQDGTQFAVKLEASEDHGEVESLEMHAHFSGPSRRVKQLH